MNYVLNGREAECCGCSSCAAACPLGCICMKENVEGFFYPNVDFEHCIHCEKCKKACPVLAVHTDYSVPVAWGTVANDAEIQKESASGGVFTLLARAVLHENGTVFGAAFTDDFRGVHHIAIDKETELGLLRTSKYLQSNIENTYLETKTKLEAGQKVLYSGTGCQIAGLKAFLVKEYDNLLCVDVICHGVPSIKLWAKYLDEIGRRYRGKITSVNFRHKKNGWKQFGMKIGTYYRDLNNDPYLQMFLRNYCLRESCYNCFAKENGSGADITIGDFWGVEKVAPDLANPMGTSLVLIHSRKGQKWFNKIQGEMKCREVTYSEAIKHNSAYLQSVTRPEERDAFYHDLKKLPWEQMVRLYGSQNLKKTIKRKMGIIWKVLNGYNDLRGGGKFQYGLLIQFDDSRKK